MCSDERRRGEAEAESRIYGSKFPGLTRVRTGESGLNTVENILIIAVAAIILIGLFQFFNVRVWTQVKSSINSLLGAKF